MTKQTETIIHQKPSGLWRKSRLLLIAAAVFMIAGGWLIYFQWFRKPVLPAPAVNTTAWLEQDFQALTGSSWLQTHRYGDCPTTAGEEWPKLAVDCFVPEPMDGPSEIDRSMVSEPTGLYYKHLTPGDFWELFPGSVLANAEEMNKLMKNRMEGQAERFGEISVDSLIVGLEDGERGNKVKSLSLMVHPALERPIVKIIGVEARAKNLYQPFIEGATGQPVNPAEVLELYAAALNYCGEEALGGEQKGLGIRKQFGEYTAVVQWWKSLKDCNIHLVKSIK